MWPSLPRRFPRRRRRVSEAANALCQQNLGLAHHCARRFVGRGIAYEELAQQAIAALLQAAQRFDVSRGLCFSTYAVPCVLGELKRFCERSSTAHIPRTDREAFRRAHREREAFLAREGREPTLPELAQALGETPEALGAVLSGAPCAAAPLDDAMPDPQGGDFVDELLLRDVLDRLPPPMPRLLRLRCEQGLSQADVAARLQMTQVQVSRLERRAKELLRRQLTG